MRQCQVQKKCSWLRFTHSSIELYMYIIYITCLGRDQGRYRESGERDRSWQLNSALIAPLASALTMAQLGQLYAQPWGLSPDPGLKSRVQLKGDVAPEGRGQCCPVWRFDTCTLRASWGESHSPVFPHKKTRQANKKPLLLFFYCKVTKLF